MAFAEQASVAAFARMHAELASMGAPRALVRGAVAAGRDEVRHARVMARFATARGARVPRVRVRSAGAADERSASAVAIENAVEGCVRETYGALVLAWQAAHAGDPELRAAFTRVARDEARHASLAWALASWLEPRLDAKARARVNAARSRAVARLLRERREPPSSLAREAGLPTASEARALLGAMTRELGLTTAARRRSPQRAAPSP
jgi:rubrerythrin